MQHMNAKLVEDIANAVLYEGYMLYPYRAVVGEESAAMEFRSGLSEKLQRSAAAGVDKWFTQTECLVLGNPKTEIEIKVRFLQAIARTMGELEQPIDELPEHGEPAFHSIGSLRVGEQMLQTWQEATRTQRNRGPGRRPRVDSWPRGAIVQPVGAKGSGAGARRGKRITGLIVRTQEAIERKNSVSAELMSRRRRTSQAHGANESNIARHGTARP